MAAKKAPAADRALDAFMAKMAKSYGEGTFQLGREPSKYEVIPTGSIVLDYQLAVGGWVEGRLHELWGPPGIGKTTLAIISSVEAQKKYPDKLVAWIDVEKRHDKKWMRDHGLDLQRTVIVEPITAEEVADQLKDMCRSGLFSFIVLDSIGFMITENQIDKDAGDATVGDVAKLVTRMVEIAAGTAMQSGTTILFLNQVRANIGYGADTDTPGGFALKHSTTIRGKMRRTGEKPYKVRLGGDDVIVGHQVAVYTERNTVAPAYRTATFNLFHVPTQQYGPIGIDRADEAVTIGIKTGVIQQSGAWYTITPTGERVNGRGALVETLRSQPDVVERIRELALESVANEVIEEATDAEIKFDTPDGKAALEAQ